MDSVSTKKNTVTINVTGTASINCHIKKSNRLLYFSYSFINEHINIDSIIVCYHYAKQKGIKQNGK